MKEKTLICISFIRRPELRYLLIISNYRIIFIRTSNPFFGSILGAIVDGIFYSSRLKKLNETLKKNKNDLDKALEVNLGKEIFLLKDIQLLDFKDDVFSIHLKNQDILKYKFDKNIGFIPYLDNNITAKNVHGKMSNLRRDFLNVINDINNSTVSNLD